MSPICAHSPLEFFPEIPMIPKLTSPPRSRKSRAGNTDKEDGARQVNAGSLDRDGAAERRDAILIKALDRHPVRLPDSERAQLEGRALVDEALIRLVQL